jgi:hypothetical protein
LHSSEHLNGLLKVAGFGAHLDQFTHRPGAGLGIATAIRQALQASSAL